MNLHLFHSLWDRKPFQMNILIDFIWNFIRRVLIRNALYKSFWSKMKTLNATSEMIRLYSAKLVLRWGKRTEVLKKPLKMKEERLFFSLLKPDTGWVGWPKLKLRDWSHTLSWKSRLRGYGGNIISWGQARQSCTEHSIYWDDMLSKEKLNYWAAKQQIWWVIAPSSLLLPALSSRSERHLHFALIKLCQASWMWYRFCC